MHEAQTLDAITPELAPPERYARLRVALASLMEGERDWLANLANAAAALYAALPDLNWAGFYLMRGGELVVGPFQGLPACVRIAIGRGVCGTAALQRRTLVVEDVHAFPGHIACDPRSRSEIVVPIFWSGDVVAVIDLDSDRRGRFDDADRVGLEAIAADLATSIDWGRATAS